MYKLGEKVGGGGQGSVYSLNGEVDLCAKIRNEGERHGIDRGLYQRIIYGIPSIIHYEHDRYLEILEKLPKELHQYLIRVDGVKEVESFDSEVVKEALIMELVRNTHGKVAQTFWAYLAGGGEVDREFWEIVVATNEAHKRFKTAMLTSSFMNILVQDERTPRFIDFAVGFEMFRYQPWLRLGKFHDAKIDRTFERTLNSLPESVFVPAFVRTSVIER